MPRAFAYALFTLAAVLAINSALGPLGGNLITYAVSPSLLNQTIGLEVVTIGLVVPIAVIAGMLALRGHRAAAALAFGPASYAAYMFLQYVLGPEYSTYTITAFFHTAVFGLACGVAGWAWTLAGRQPVPRLSVRRRRTVATILLVLAAFILSRYAGAVSGSLTGAALPAEFVDARTFYWSIFLLDLGVVVPATIVAGYGLFRDARFAHHAVYALMAWYALVPPSVAAMSATMVIRNDPHASVGQAILLTAVSLVFAAAAVWIYAPLAQAEEMDSPPRLEDSAAAQPTSAEPDPVL